MNTADCGRPLNFLLVDHYNDGTYQGSVFKTAAQNINVTYNRACCGVVPTSAVLEVGPISLGLLSAMLGALAVLLL